MSEIQFEITLIYYNLAQSYARKTRAPSCSQMSKRNRHDKNGKAVCISE